MELIKNPDMRLVLIFLLTVCALLGKTIGAVCPDFWTDFQGSCYALSQNRQPWLQANLICQKHGGHLAIIETAAENAFITTLMKNTQVHHVDAWIGANDMKSAGNFTWVGGDEPITYSDWSPGEPSSEHEHCVDIKIHDGYKWNDQRCGSHQNFICECSPLDEIVG